jgi:hypothetical protein
MPRGGEVEHFNSDPSKSSGSVVSSSAQLGPTPSEATSGPSGHHKEPHHRSAGFRVVHTTLTLPPVTGANQNKTPILAPLGSDDPASRDRHMISLLNSAKPNVAFPQFDGSYPKLWIKNCENYFEVYLVESYL